MTTTLVSVPADDVNLAGVLSTPDGPGPHPAALIIAGSGPLDRNGDVRRLHLGVSRRLAQLLADAGWATLRYDKRGVGASGGDYLSTGFHRELADTRAAFRWLAGRSDTAEVIAVGHSVGALFAAELAASEPGIDGAILLSYTARDGESTLRWQAGEIGRTVPKPVRWVMGVLGTSIEKQQRLAIARLRATTEPVARIKGRKVNARWMREFADYSPMPALRAIGVPILAITGSKDVQVDPADLAVIAEVLGPRATTVCAADVDHILRHEEQPMSSPRRYTKQADRPLDPSVTEAVAIWLGGFPPRVREDGAMTTPSPS